MDPRLDLLLLLLLQLDRRDRVEGQQRYLRPNDGTRRRNPEIQSLHGAAGRRPIIPVPRSGRGERGLWKRLAPPQKEDEKMHDRGSEKSIPPKRSLGNAPLGVGAAVEGFGDRR